MNTKKTLLSIIVAFFLIFAPSISAQTIDVSEADSCQSETGNCGDILAEILKNVDNNTRFGILDSLPNDQKNEVIRNIDEIFKNARREFVENNETLNQRNTIQEVSFIGWDGNRITRPSSSLDEDSEFNRFIIDAMKQASRETPYQITDTFTQDNQGNRNIQFYDTLATFFTPFYRVSALETDNFVSLHDSTTLSVQQYHGRNPRNYHRVHPMGFMNSNGIQYGFYRIDYLTIWDNDSGQRIMPVCTGVLWTFNQYYPWLVNPIVSALTPVLSSHKWDVERSAVLVAAPTSAPGTYSTNHTDYYIHSVYAAAHEWTDSDRSVTTYPNPAVQGHVELYLAYSKHATYFGNPSYLPLTPNWAVVAAYQTIQMLWAMQIIDQWEHMQISLLLGDLFSLCFVEHFYHGGTTNFASPRTNVGEPSAPLNGSRFILDPKVLPKLTWPLWW